MMVTPSIVRVMGHRDIWFSSLVLRLFSLALCSVIWLLYKLYGHVRGLGYIYFYRHHHHGP